MTGGSRCRSVNQFPETSEKESERVDYEIDIKVTRQVRGDSVRVKLVKVTVEPPDQEYRCHFMQVCIWPKSCQINWQEDGGHCGVLPWPADWPGLSYTQIEYEADLVSLATRLAVQEWQRRQEGGT
jgi:hypothetical protein